MTSRSSRDRRITTKDGPDLAGLLPLIKRQIAAYFFSEITKEDREDLAGDAFLGILELARAGRIRGEAKITTLAHSITRNKMADYLRRKYREREFRAMVNIDIFADPTEGPESRALFSAVLEAAEKLPDLQRQTFFLCGLGDIHPLRVAEQIGVGEATIRIAYSRARRNLRKAIEGPENGKGRLDKETKFSWMRRFLEAYIRLGNISGMLSPGLEWEAEQAVQAIAADIKNERGK